jgi:hypothetical protein
VTGGEKKPSWMYEKFIGKMEILPANDGHAE